MTAATNVEPDEESTDLVELSPLEQAWQRSVALVPVLPTGWLAHLPEKPVDMSALSYIARLMDMLPPATDDVVDKIAMSILTAENKASENLIWETVGSKDVIGRRFIWHSVHIQPSDYKDGALPYYLACDVTDLASGERTVLTTGSVNLCATLIHAQLVGGLPWEGEIVGPRRPTASGHVPLHMRWGSRIVEPAPQPEERDL